MEKLARVNRKNGAKMADIFILPFLNKKREKLFKKTLLQGEALFGYLFSGMCSVVLMT